MLLFNVCRTSVTGPTMWSSTGLGPPTYRPFDFPYDDYRGGMGEFASLGGSSSWASTAAPAHSSVVVSSAPEQSNTQDTVSI